MLIITSVCLPIRHDKLNDIVDEDKGTEMSDGDKRKILDAIMTKIKDSDVGEDDANSKAEALKDNGDYDNHDEDKTSSSSSTSSDKVLPSSNLTVIDDIKNSLKGNITDGDVPIIVLLLPPEEEIPDELTTVNSISEKRLRRRRKKKDRKVN